jgi:murein DD-endopeptidase MepM/ murein hydrolase activator NlpD
MRKKALLALLGTLIVLGGGVAAFRAGPSPTIDISSNLPAIGKRTVITAAVSEPVRGLTHVRVEVEQGNMAAVLADRTYRPRPAWFPWGPGQDRDELVVEVGLETVEGLREGPAAIRVIAERAPAWLRSPPPAVATLSLEVKTRPPSLQISSTQTYAAQGGAETVVYQVSHDSVRDGVRAGDWFFPGSPLPGGTPGQRFALFGVPYDLDDVNRVHLVAEDALGNEASMSFVDRFFGQKLKTEEIRLSESFMQRVVPPILANTPDLADRGSALANYLLVNDELRKRNNERLIAYATKSKPAFLWREVFMQFPNAKVMSEFAARRSYVLDGQVVDHQDHLGFDLASVQRVEIPAVNDGIVVMATYFGIYGNTVLIDHGYGLMSLYGHLSEMSVAEGAEVKRGQIIGRSGQTGLAGGDHLHFTMLLQGLPVNPREWWDAKWIRDRLKRKLGDALPFEQAGGR